MQEQFDYAQGLGKMQASLVFNLFYARNFSTEFSRTDHRPEDCSRCTKLPAAASHEPLGLTMTAKMSSHTSIEQSAVLVPSLGAVGAQFQECSDVSNFVNIK